MQGPGCPSYISRRVTYLGPIGMTMSVLSSHSAFLEEPPEDLIYLLLGLQLM